MKCGHLAAVGAFACVLWMSTAVYARSEDAPTVEKTQPVQAVHSVATPAESQGLRIENAVVCQDVIDRKPVQSAEVFEKNTPRVYCFFRVVGANEEASVTCNWYYKGVLKSSVKLPVRSANWRTWSSKNLSPEWTGEWMVEILSAEGKPLESIIFYVQ